MPTTGTIIAALRYASGVLIGADSQASDPIAEHPMIGARWTVDKLKCPGGQALVVGCAGSWGTAQRLHGRLDGATLRPNQFARRELVQGVLDGLFRPEYEAARQRVQLPFGGDAILTLSATWAGGSPHILEHEPSGDSCWHDAFQAIGSGKPVAHAVYRSLGGPALSGLSERTAIPALIRIIQTTIDVDMMGVAEPIRLWRVDASGARRYPEPEMDAHKQFVAEWKARERDALFAMDSALA